VLNAEQQYQTAALDAVRSNARRLADTAKLFHALGGGVVARHGSGVAPEWESNSRRGPQ